MIPVLKNYDVVAYDTETTGFNENAGARVFSFSLSTPDDRDFYYDIRYSTLYEVLNLGLDSEKMIELATNFDGISWINDEFASFNGKIVCHNLSFDYRLSFATGIFIELEKCRDTCILACLINEHEFSYSLDNLSKKYTSVRKRGDRLYKEMAVMFGGRATKNVQMKRISEAPPTMVGPYAASDTRATLDLYNWQVKEIAKQGLEKIVEFEERLTPIFIKTEMRGVRVDIVAAEIAVAGLSAEIKKEQKELDELAGFKCNPQPSSDIKKLFKPEWREGRWWACDGTPLQQTDSGQASIGADALRSMSHPAAAKILSLRSLIKTRDTFLVGHVLESACNGRVYPNINQTKGEDGGTGTGRLSYTSPALQQIPDRNKRVAEIVKKVFLPEIGHKWVDGDMASFEVRIFGHLVGTADIVEAYKNNPETDFHQFVSDLTGLVRNATYNGQPNAKQLNLSMIFNQGNGTTAEQMGMPWSWESFIPNGSKEEVIYKKAGEEAMSVINTYHNKLPGVKKLADGCKSVAESRNWLFTRYGRHLRFPRGFKSYKASGILIQATSADENKQNWLRINEALEGTGGHMLLNTHDSYSMSIPEDDCEAIARKVKLAVEEDRGLRVPLILEVQEPGNNWWESKSSKRWM